MGESLLSFRYENHVVASIITDVNNQVQQNPDMVGLAKSAPITIQFTREIEGGSVVSRPQNGESLKRLV
jgi:hypothetical protein